jgi:hypothetical protein
VANAKQFSSGQLHLRHLETLDCRAFAYDAEDRNGKTNSKFSDVSILFTTLWRTPAAYRLGNVLSYRLLRQATELNLPSGGSVHDKGVVT